MKPADVSIKCIIKSENKILGLVNIPKILAIKCFECESVFDFESFEVWKKQFKEVEGIEKSVQDYIKTINWVAKIHGSKWIFLCAKHR